MLRAHVLQPVESEREAISDIKTVLMWRSVPLTVRAAVTLTLNMTRSVVSV